MNLLLKRVYSSTWDTIGVLYINGEAECLTLEDEKREIKVKGHTRIPPGTYPVTLKWSSTHSPRYGHQMLAIENVPNFQGILIHKGNTSVDTEGCVLVGNVWKLNPDGPSQLLESGLAYDRIYPIIANGCREGIVDLFVIDADE